MGTVLTDTLIAFVCACALIVVIVAGIILHNTALPYLAGGWFIIRGDTELGPFHSRPDLKMVVYDKLKFRPGHLFRKSEREWVPR